MPSGSQRLSSHCPRSPAPHPLPPPGYLNLLSVFPANPSFPAPQPLGWFPSPHSIFNVLLFILLPLQPILPLSPAFFQDSCLFSIPVHLTALSEAPTCSSENFSSFHHVISPESLLLIFLLTPVLVSLFPGPFLPHPPHLIHHPLNLHLPHSLHLATSSLPFLFLKLGCERRLGAGHAVKPRSRRARL